MKYELPRPLSILNKDKLYAMSIEGGVLNK